LKYWLLTTEFPPFFGGGIGTYSSITAKMMADQGHEVSVFVNDAFANDIKIEKKENDLRIIRFNPVRTQSSGFLGHVTNISYEFAHIVKYFVEKEGRPDIIESQEYLGIAYYLLQYKYLLYDWCKDIPVIITMHSPSFLYMEYNHVPEYKYPNYWICEMERFCLQAADLLISPSSYMLIELKKRFQLNNKNVVKLPNPFSSKEFVANNTTFQNHSGEIVFFGKLTIQKGAFHLLNYFKKLWDEGFSRPLYLLGGQDIVYHAEGKSMGDLIKKKYKNYINRGLLKLEGRIKPVNIADRLSKAEVVIIPSANDNLPYTVFEMMALGKILLIAKQGGQSEVIENYKEGFVFDHEHPESFSIQLKKILELTDEERKSISRQAVQKLSSVYNPETIYEKKYKEIEKLISSFTSADGIFPFIRTLVNSSGDNASMNDSKGLLSIVIPYYNMGAYIDETIKSILKSEYDHKEIIIVNDGSCEDDSIKKLSQYRQMENIRVIDVKNKGLAHARNLGAEAAGGEFLAFLDADDKVGATYYSKAIKVLRQYHNVQFSGCWTIYFDHSEKTWPAFSPEPPVILYHNTTNSSALVYKRRYFLEHGNNATDMPFPGLEDYESIISLLESGCNGVILPEILFHYRVRSDSMIRSISSTKKILLHQDITDKHKKFYATFAAELFGLLNANGPGIFKDNPSLDYHLTEKIPFAGSLSRKLIYLVKKNKLTRKMAYKIYRLLNSRP
jgi:glycosyltransferase involved in cell wall biosynthesis